MSAMYYARPEDSFDDSLISPSQALFPPDLFTNGASAPIPAATALPLPGGGGSYNYNNHRDSISGTSDFSGTGQMDEDDFAAFQHSLFSGPRSGQGSFSSHSHQQGHSRIPSLSPSNGSGSYLSANNFGVHPNLAGTANPGGSGNSVGSYNQGLSPHAHSLSSASPRSTISAPTSISTGMADDFIFGNPLAQDELDQLLYQDAGVMPGTDGGKGAGTGMGDQSIFHLPGWSFQYPGNNSFQQVGNGGGDGGYQQPSQYQPYTNGNDSLFNLQNMTSPKSNPAAQFQPQPISGFNQNLTSGSNAGLPSGDRSAEAMRRVAQQATMERDRALEEVRRQQTLQAQQIEALQRQQQQGQPGGGGMGQLQTIPPSWMNRGPAQNGTTSAPIPTAPSKAFTKRAVSPPPRKGRPPKSARPPVSSGDSASPPEQPVGKHNKTERRYRQKVQVAQAALRDAVPALRVHYGTSRPDQLVSTDFRSADGSVDGLGEVSRPNASAKATILNGARMYIELLQSRTAGMQRKIDELEAYRLAVGGQADLDRWRADFGVRETAVLAEAARIKAEQEGDDDDGSDSEEEEEEEVTKKRKRGPVPGSKKKKKDAAVVGTDAGGNGVRVFAAFAMSFSLVPSASTLLRHQPAGDLTPGHVLSGETTPTQVISRLPLITAEHLYRLATKVVPKAAVPMPGTMVDWTWRLLVAAVLVLVLGPMIRAWTKVEDEDVPAGDVLEVGAEAVKLGLRLRGPEQEEWVDYAARSLGKTSAPTPLARYHLALKLKRTASTPYALALLALVQPELPFFESSQSIWIRARLALSPGDSAPLQAVLALPFDEARHGLSLLSPTSAPIAAIAEQITLVHLYDLYSRLFIRLVDATISRSQLPISIKALLSNLSRSSPELKGDLGVMDQEIRAAIDGVGRGTAAHALGLVLVGLWGVFTGPAPSAQAALASALAGEEISGSGLQSVPAMLDLLYPGASSLSSDMKYRLDALPQNALALDKLALVCIGYIRLLHTSGLGLGGVSRPDKAKVVAKATAELRLVISQTHFVGLDSASTARGEVYELEEEALEEEDGTGEEGPPEGESFESAKERLVGVLSGIGRRAAGRVDGADDSGLDAEIDDL